ncbi:hypothetical protein BZA77DRAFT_341355 [Pyronema omphalodes]|nr:hypothetical protein BZA77DRAFT_341355 [Pyronema omphalodes]
MNTTAMDDRLWPTMNGTISSYPDMHAVLKKIYESRDVDVEMSCKLHWSNYLEKLIQSALLWPNSSADNDGSNRTPEFSIEAIHCLERLQNILATIVVFSTALLIFLKLLDIAADEWLTRVEQRRVINAPQEGFSSDTTYESSQTELSELSSTETTDYELESEKSFSQSQTSFSSFTSTRELEFEPAQTYKYSYKPSAAISIDQQVSRQLNFELSQALSYGNQTSSPADSQSTSRQNSPQKSHCRQSPPYDSTAEKQYRPSPIPRSNKFYSHSNRVSTSPTPARSIIFQGSQREEARHIKREKQASSLTYYDRSSSVTDQTDSLPSDSSSVACFSPLKTVGQLSPPSTFLTPKPSPRISTAQLALSSFKPGDLVLRPSPDGPHDGPYLLVNLLADGRAELEIPPGSLAGRWYHSGNLIKYSGPLTARAVASWWKQRDGKYSIESIRGERWRKNRKQYRVHWRGWPSEDDTWEYADGIEEVDRRIIRGSPSAVVERFEWGLGRR